MKVFVYKDVDRVLSITHDSDGLFLEIESGDRYITGFSIPKSEIEKLKSFLKKIK